MEGDTNSRKKSFVLITGGSRGFGKCIAQHVFRIVGNNSTVVLVARNKEKLAETKAVVLSKQADLDVRTLAQDLGSLDGPGALDLMNSAIDSCQISDFDKAIIIHNAGALGSISKTVDQLDDLQDLQKYYNLNVHSVFMLNSAFLKVFKDFTSEPNKCLIINVSSLAAINPFSGWAQYCSAKAARDLYFKVCASEFPNVKVLNYAPGPLLTDMTDIIIKEALPSVSEWFVDSKAKNKLVSCEDSVKKLFVIVQEGNYTSGDHIDFFD